MFIPKRWISPLDGIIAIDNIFVDLPQVHRSRESKRARRKQRKFIRVYTGSFAWYPLGFSYVQIGNELHVLELWCDDDLGTRNRPEVDAVVGEGS